MLADLDDLLIAIYVFADDFLPKRDPSRPGPKPRIGDAEVICLAVAQVLLDCPKERRFLRFAKRRLGHLFPYIPGQSGYNKRVRAVAPQIVTLLGYLARTSPSWCDGLRLIDATPVPCGQSRETVKRSEFAGYAAYGWCAAHSRHFWGFKLYLLAASDGMPIAFCLAPANVPEREVVAGMLDGIDLSGYTVIGDKGLSGAEIEELVALLGGAFLRPDRRDERPRFGSLGGVRQWIEAIFDQLKDQLSLERHGAHTMVGLCARVAQRLLALGACVWHNWQIGEPGRGLIAYDH
ncbi:MAG TPA: IS982 family transposase [Solirubrobacterales bacterium]|nr:IS982 family transposase [Solirubrobacterales bacterium]